MSFFGDLIERLARPPEELRAESLRHWSTSIDGTTQIAAITARERNRVAGVVKNIRIDPREGRGSIEATITDGTGEVIAKWLGRHSLSGIRLGVGVILEGIVGRQGDDLVILNPEYELTAGPDHG